MESGDDGLESEANVRPRPCLTGAGSPGAQSTATARGPSRQARLNWSAEGARTAYSARHTCPKTPETRSRNRSVRQAASNGVRTIIVETASRFARDLIVQETGWPFLRDAGITLIAADSPEAFLDDTPTATKTPRRP